MAEQNQYKIDMHGLRFGRLVVTSCAGRQHNRKYKWNAVCDCGTQVCTDGADLRSGTTQSCGCLQREKARKSGDRTRTHGMSSTSTYSIWDSMLPRCNNAPRKDFFRYGGKGVTVCDRWNSFENFLADMGHRPDGCSIDRINNNLGYSPENCRWATVKQQNRNQVTNRLISWNGQTKCLADWAEHLNINTNTLYARLTKYQWSVERAFTAPVMKEYGHA